MPRISSEPYFHTMNGAFQNLVSEHSVEGVPASLYNLTKSVLDPYNLILIETQVFHLCHMMSIVAKSTCWEFKTWLYTSYHVGNAVSFIKQRGYCMKDGRISGYPDTKYMTVCQIEQRLTASSFSAKLLHIRQLVVSYSVALLRMMKWLQWRIS